MNDGKIEDEAAIIGRVRIRRSTVILGKSVVKGPSITGEECEIGRNAYVGPYTAIGNRCHIASAEVDGSIVMDDTFVDVLRRFVRSMIGKWSKILNADGLLPKGERLVVGKNTTIHP